MASRDTDREEETKELDDNGEEIEYVEEKAEQSPLLRLAEWKFLLTLDDSIVAPAEKSSIETKLNAEIDQYSMSAYLIYLNKLLPQRFPLNADKLSQYEKKNAEQLEGLNQKIVTAEKNAGDTEIRQAMLEKANWYARIGDEEKSIVEYEKTLEKTVGTASKIDVVLAMVRISLAFDNNRHLKKYIEKAKEMVEKGGDWERKNLLLVYEAMYYVIHRNFAAASKLFIEALQTFTCYELFSYNHFILYTIIPSMISIDRVTLKEKLLKQPEILSVIDQIPHLRSFLFSLYKCNYAEFFSALTHLYPRLQLDRYYSPHLSYYIREIRIVAYQQFLASYRSVTLASMATAFGVSRSFLDEELFRFISAGRVNGKIDRVAGTVEATRKDRKNAHYQQVLKHGDHLLHRIQKLTKVISY